MVQTVATTPGEATAIAKELLPYVQFVKHEVLADRQQREARQSKLKQAIVLGNVEHGKVRIYFSSTSGIGLVETTVWHADTDNVILKGGVFIPVHAIHRIEF